MDQPSPSVKLFVGHSFGELAKTPIYLRCSGATQCLALQQAKGAIGSLACDTSFKMLRGCAQLLESALGPEGILFDHVPGHAGDPFNEICDQVAKQEGQKGFYLPRPDLYLKTWRQLIPYLWLLFGENVGAPTFQGEGFSVLPLSSHRKLLHHHWNALFLANKLLLSQSA